MYVLTNYFFAITDICVTMSVRTIEFNHVLKKNFVRAKDILCT